MNLPPSPAPAGSPAPRPPAPDAASRLQRFLQAAVRTFHAYARWLVGISWKRFVLLSVLLMIAAAILQGIPPFSWGTESLVEIRESEHRRSKPVRPPEPAGNPPPTEKHPEGLDISIDERGVRITVRTPPSAQPSASGSEPASSTPPASGPVAASAPAAPAKSESDEHRHTRRVKTDSVLPDLALLWILASLLIKITYKGQMQAREQVARATETAEAEQLRRQVVEARMAAMQAQVEPHFLFNTLASIDHLIETDPPRASRMQKSLIALLRATLPDLREGVGGPRALAQELAVITPYLDILKQRMEERLQTVIEVPEGLRSAELPPLMIQGLVENAIKHGLEPQPAGGTLWVKAEVAHGQLVISAQDNGVGLGALPSGGTGTGLASIRERLALLYGPQARLEVVAVPTGGTLARLVLPYRTVGPTTSQAA